MFLTRLTTINFFNLNASLIMLTKGIPGMFARRVLIISAIVSSFVFEGLISF